ncbi:hypothetical protein UJ101_02300 [Flavobacteriaceae bacterium UJ101]|nr:hypothetical protein UJ101_02300 [Flavobacteriaceae bacterium UJ101]
MKSVFDLNDQSLDHKIIEALERLSNAFRHLLWKEYDTHKLSPIQIQMLIFFLFHSEEKRKVSYLAKEFNLSKATISDSIKTLLNKGFIIKEKDPIDSRSFCIHLTHEGTNIAKKLSLYPNALKLPIEKINEIDKHLFYKNLLDIIYSLNQQGTISIQRMCFTCYQYEKKGNNHYCNLLKKKLHVSELQIDCYDYQPIDINHNGKFN